MCFRLETLGSISRFDRSKLVAVALGSQNVDIDAPAMPETPKNIINALLFVASNDDSRMSKWRWQDAAFHAAVAG